MQILKNILNVDDKKAEYLDLYWQGLGLTDMKMYGTCRKQHNKIFLAYVTGKFKKEELSKYLTMILKKIGYTLGKVDGKKVKNYFIKNNVKFPPIYIIYNFFILSESSPITAINIPNNKKIKTLFSIWKALKLIKPSKHYTANYYTVSKNRKLNCIFNLIDGQKLEQEYQSLKNIGAMQYILNVCDKIDKAYSYEYYTYISIEQCLLVAILLRLITRRFKLKSLTSKKYIVDYVSKMKIKDKETKNQIIAILWKMMQSDFVQNVKNQKIKTQNKKCHNTDCKLI